MCNSEDGPDCNCSCTCRGCTPGQKWGTFEVRDAIGRKTKEEASCKCPTGYKYRCAGDPNRGDPTGQHPEGLGAGADGFSCMMSNCNPATDKNCYTSKYECDWGTAQDGTGNCDDPSDVDMRTTLSSYVNPLQAQGGQAKQGKNESGGTKTYWWVLGGGLALSVVVFIALALKAKRRADRGLPFEY